MAETKSRLLYILKYLWQNTDAKHYATTGDFLLHFSSVYGIINSNFTPLEISTF